jgi:integrase
VVKGYVARKGGRWHAVIYEGLDPITRRERRSWHAAGTERSDAEALAARLAAERNGRDDAVRKLTFGAYLTTQWLPGKRLTLRASTWDGYRRKVDRHILPTLGRITIRGLRPAHLEALYERLLHPDDGRRPLAPKSVLEIHLIIRGALAHAVRKGLVSQNVALVAHAPRLRSIPKLEHHVWTPEQLRLFLRAAAGHRLFPAFWLAAATGMRRGELLGLRWTDIDLTKGTIAVNRGIVAVAYELHVTRGKTRNARRPINLDTTTIAMLRAWQTWQHTEQHAAGIANHGWVFTDTNGQPVHPHAISQAFERIAVRAGLPLIRLHDLRHTHATLLAQAGVHPKVVSERLGHANAKFTIETYQHVMPGMQADAAVVVEDLMGPPGEMLLPALASTGSTRLKRRENTAEQR